MSKYSLLRTATADAQIVEIIRYVAADSGSRKIALSCLEKMEESIYQLASFSYIGAVPRYAALRRQGYRFVVSDRWLIFYKVFEQKKEVIIYAVLDASRDYLNLL